MISARTVLMPRPTAFVLEDAEVGAAISPVDRRPQEEDLRGRRHRRSPRLRLADGPDPPGAVLGAGYPAGLDGDAAAGVADLAAPAPELGEAGDVHDEPTATARRLAPLFDARGARGEGEIAFDPGLVGREMDAQRAHRIDDLDAKGPHARLGGILGRTTGRVEGVLLPVPHDAESAVHDAAIRVDGQPDGEVELAVLGVAVHPVAVVDVAIARHRLGDGLRRLVDREVVVAGEHDHLRVRAPTALGSGRAARAKTAPAGRLVSAREA
jgi:hypothetical protein